MLKACYLLLIIANIVVYITHNRYGKAFETLSFVFIVVYAAGTRYDVNSYIAHDQINYYYNYLYPNDIGSYAIGYKLINIVASKLGLSFDAFYVLIIAICTLAVFRAAYRISGNCVVVSVVFLLYYMIVAVDLLRNYMAFAILLNCFPYLLSDSRRDKWKFAIGIMIASTIHLSFVLYLLLLLRNLNLRKVLDSSVFKIITGIILSSFVAILALGLQSYVSRMALGVISVLSVDSYNRYAFYATRSTHLSSLVPFAIYIMVLFALTKWKKRENSIIYYSRGMLTTIERSDVYLVFLVSSVYLIFAFISTVFFRIVRDLSVVMLLYLSCSRDTTIRQRTFNIAVVTSVNLSWFIFDIVLKGQWLNFKEFFFQNTIL